MIDLIALGMAGIAGVLVASDPLEGHLWNVALLLGFVLIGASVLLATIEGGQAFI